MTERRAELIKHGHLIFEEFIPKRAPRPESS